MNADRLEFFRNQLRGVPIEDLGRMMWQVLMQATDEAARDEREACAKVCEDEACGGSAYNSAAIHLSFRIRARGEK